MIKRILFVQWLACGVLPLLAQSPPQVDDSSRPAVAALRGLAQTIKECPRALSSEKKWGKRPAEIERWYVGPPQNVVWDVMPSTSVRSPYMGYIEFSLSENYWVPDEVKDKFMNSDAGSSAELVKKHLGKYRYEFDLGPNGLELTRMLRAPTLLGQPLAGKWVDDSPDDTCWQKAARNVQAMSNRAGSSTQTSPRTEPNRVAVEVVSGSQYNSSFGLVGRDEGTFYVVRSADTAFLLSCTRNWRWEAKCPVLAAGEKFSLAIDGTHVHLTGTKEGRPVDIKLEYERSRELPSNTSLASAAAPQNAPADLAAAPISDSGNAFLAHCDTGGDTIVKEACKVWVDGFFNGLAAGIAAATQKLDQTLQRTPWSAFPKRQHMASSFP